MVTENSYSARNGGSLIERFFSLEVLVDCCALGCRLQARARPTGVKPEEKNLWLGLGLNLTFSLEVLVDCCVWSAG